MSELTAAAQPNAALPAEALQCAGELSLCFYSSTLLQQRQSATRSSRSSFCAVVWDDTLTE